MSSSVDGVFRQSSRTGLELKKRQKQNTTQGKEHKRDSLHSYYLIFPMICFFHVYTNSMFILVLSVFYIIFFCFERRWCIPTKLYPCYLNFVIFTRVEHFLLWSSRIYLLLFKAVIKIGVKIPTARPRAIIIQQHICFLFFF